MQFKVDTNVRRFFSDVIDLDGDDDDGDDDDDDDDDLT